MKSILTVLFRNRLTLPFLRLVGLCLVAAYFAICRDFRFSPIWALAYPAVALGVAWLTVGVLNLDNRFPRLRNYLAGDIQNYERPSEFVWAHKKAEYLLAPASKGWPLLLTPAEDGLACVPLLSFGVNLFSSTAAGAVFGFLHLGRYSYFECLSKAIYYGTAYLLVLPHGLLTLIAGHFLTDLAAFSGIYAAQRRIKSRLRQ